MFSSFISQKYETADNSDSFSNSPESLDLDSNNLLLNSFSLNLDESENQENYKFQSSLEIQNIEFKFKSCLENTFEDKSSIEIPSLPFCLTDNASQKKDNILFDVKKNTPPRGRKIGRIQEKYGRLHSKFSDDNIIRKIQVHFINFIRNFINLKLLQLGFDEQLYKISSFSKQNENKKKFLLLKNMTIEQILSQDISPKYKKEKNKKINVILMDKIKSDPIISNLLYANFLTVFRELYFNEKGIKLNLPKNIKVYKDLVNKNKNEPLYVKKLNQCLDKYFLC